jgi:uncharacterized protein (TIGR03089 family)
MTETLPQTLAVATRRDPAAPLLTWYDDASGDRTELSGATLENWVSKTANLFADGAGTGPGDVVAVLLRPHWQTAAIVLGASAAGLAVVTGGAPRPVEALVTSPDGVETAAAWPAGERYVTGLLPLAMPLRTVPAGFVDYPTEVRGHGDHFRPVQPVAPGDPAVAGPPALSHRELIARATGRAGELGIGAGDRVLIDARAHADIVDWLVAPLVAGASIVLCANLDPAKVAARVSAEKVSLTLT